MILKKSNEKLCGEIEAFFKICRPNGRCHTDQIVSAEKLAELMPF
jgi:hypothetical protein